MRIPSRLARPLLTAAILCAAVFACLPARPAAAAAEGEGRPILLAQSGAVLPVDEIDPDFYDPFAEKEAARAQEAAAMAPDPFQGWNRFWFTFNDKFYFWVFKPVAQGYETVVFEDWRIGIRNFFRNLLFPVRLVNCLLQGKLMTAGAEVSRFICNTAFGFGGFGQPARSLKPLHPSIGSGEEDMGQTFGSWGIPNGPYFVWPFLGPMTTRDTAGYVGDLFLDPLSYVTPWYDSIAIKAYSKLNDTSLRIGEYERIKEASLDPYIAIRDAYLRYRAKRVAE